MASSWRYLENNYLAGMQPGQAFNTADIVQTLGVTSHEATCLIQAYLVAQRAINSSTLYVLHRQGRTRAAVWTVGVRSRDVKELTRQCMDDITIKVMDALAPDLRRMGVLNPRVAQTTAAMVQVFIANVNLLATQVP
jgi:phosphoribosyl-AMP cyclohydrolase